MQNHSNENEFDLHENELVGGTHFHMNGLHLDSFSHKAKRNEEMAYCVKCYLFASS